MTNGAAVLRADLECAVQGVTVMVSSEHASIVHTVALHDRNVRDALIDALGTALLRLLRPEPALPGSSTANFGDVPRDDTPSAAPANGSTPPGSPEPPGNVAAEALRPVTAPIHRPRRDAKPVSKRPVQRTVEVTAGLGLEWWQRQAAAGATLDASYGSRELALRAEVAAFAAVPSADAFDALEIDGSLAVRWQPGWSLGTRVSVGMGASWLDIAPHAPYAPRGATRVSAAFATFDLSRPFWIGAWALVPRARARVFAAEQRVTLDGDDELVIGRVAPGVAFGLTRSF